MKHQLHVYINVLAVTGHPVLVQQSIRAGCTLIKIWLKKHKCSY